MANTPRTVSRGTQNGKIGKSIATIRPKLRDNTERLQDESVSGSAKASNYNTATRTGENTPLKITTCSPSTNPPALQYDDVQESGVKHHYPDQFEYTTDRSDRVPSWNSVKEDIRPKDATFRTTKEAAIVDGYHKGPMMYQYTVEDNARISSGGQVRPQDKLPTFTDGNRV